MNNDIGNVVDDNIGKTPINDDGVDHDMEKKIKFHNFLTAFFKYLVLILGALVAIVPVLVVIIGSFKTGTEFAHTSVLALPKQWTLNNYVTAFVQGGMLTGFKNTAIILVVSMAGKILLCSMFAYAISRFDFKLKGAIITLFVLAMMIPGITNQVATFQIINGLGLFNKIWSVIVLNLGTDAMSIFIFMQYLDNISVSLDESAYLEGANYFQVFWKIILPLLSAPITTVLIISGVGIYNDFYNPLLYMPDPSLAVVSTALYAFKGPFGTNWSVILAGVVIVVVPIFILFLFLQKYIYNSMAGAVK